MIKMKTFRFTYKYKNTLINLILTGIDELDALKSFEQYANKFKLPINNKMNIKVKELRTVNLK